MKTDILKISDDSDLHTDNAGNTVTLIERINNIKSRYGDGSVAMKHMHANLSYFICLDKKYSQFKLKN